MNTKSKLNPKGIASATISFLVFGAIGCYILLTVKDLNPLLWIAFCLLILGVAQLGAKIFGGFTKDTK